MDCDFTYTFYKKLISLLQQHHYDIVTYRNCIQAKRCAIMRHDIDNSLEQALRLAQLENELGINSTYFVLISSPFYNVLNEKVKNQLKTISRLGHDIGLHYDELNYTGSSSLVDNILHEKVILSDILDIPIESVSMHRPSKLTLNSNYTIPGMINSYSNYFFKEYKYISDSRRNWRENVFEIIEGERYNKLHILTHAFWYHDSSINLYDTVKNFINGASHKYYAFYDGNFTNLQEVLSENEL